MVVWEDRGKNLIRVIENSHWKPVGEAFIYISPLGAVVHTLEEVLRAIGKEKEQAREKEEAAKEAKPGEKRKLEEVFSVQIESAQSQPNPEDISNNDLPLDAPKNLKRGRKKNEDDSEKTIRSRKQP